LAQVSNPRQHIFAHGMDSADLEAAEKGKKNTKYSP
jgi:hypothetical protein